MDMLWICIAVANGIILTLGASWPLAPPPGPWSPINKGLYPIIIGYKIWISYGYA